MEKALTPSASWNEYRHCAIVKDAEYLYLRCQQRKNSRKVGINKLTSLNSSIVRTASNIFHTRPKEAEQQLNELGHILTIIIDRELNEAPNFARQHVKIRKLIVRNKLAGSFTQKAVYVILLDDTYISYLLQKNIPAMTHSLGYYLVNLFSATEVNEQLQQQEVDDLIERVCKPLFYT